MRRLNLTIGLLDLAIWITWGVVCSYFLARWFQSGKLVSASLALMSLGWALVGFSTTFPVMPEVWFKGLSASTGAFVLYAIVRVHRTGK